MFLIFHQKTQKLLIIILIIFKYEYVLKDENFKRNLRLLHNDYPRGWEPYEYEDSNEGYELAKVNLKSPN